MTLVSSSVLDMTTNPPWPIVDECYGHWREYQPDEPLDTCAQCDGAHRHHWVTWFDAPRVRPGFTCVDKMTGLGLPVRCTECGGRKCDVPACIERRHHPGPHDLLTAPLPAE